MGPRVVGTPICAAWLALVLGGCECGVPQSAADSGAGDAGQAPVDASADASTEVSCPGEVTRRFDPDECTDRYIVSALEEERGMWIASRLTLPAGSSELSSVGYALLPAQDEGDFFRCSEGAPHRVQVFTAPAGEPPPAAPEVLREMSVRSSPSTDAHRSFVHLLDPPLEVPDGHDVFVSLEMVRTSEMVCVLSCREEGFGGDTFWSNAVNPPYAWAALETFGPGFNTEVAWCVGHD